MSTIAEECGCGADFRIDDPKELWTTAAIDEAVTNWRTTHIHAPVVEAGRCAEVTPFLPASACRLRHGHTGAHEGHDGSSWSLRITTDPTAPVTEEGMKT